jgi:hypothetical protein
LRNCASEFKASKLQKLDNASHANKMVCCVQQQTSKYAQKLTKKPHNTILFERKEEVRETNKNIKLTHPTN